MLTRKGTACIKAHDMKTIISYALNSLHCSTTGHTNRADTKVLAES